MRQINDPHLTNLSPYQFGKAHAESREDALEGRPCGVRLTSFDPSKSRNRDPCLVGQVFLGLVALFAEVA
jgi:hypothetical protein